MRAVDSEVFGRSPVAQDILGTMWVGEPSDTGWAVRGSAFRRDREAARSNKQLLLTRISGVAHAAARAVCW